jgi:hypothetical protein
MEGRDFTGTSLVQVTLETPSTENGADMLSALEQELRARALAVEHERLEFGFYDDEWHQVSGAVVYNTDEVQTVLDRGIKPGVRFAVLGCFLTPFTV